MEFPTQPQTNETFPGNEVRGEVFRKVPQVSTQIYLEC